MTQGPVLIDLDETSRIDPAAAEPVPDRSDLPDGRAMQTVATLAARRPSRLARWFWASLSALLGLVLSVAAWDFVTSLLSRNAVLGGLAVVLVAVVAGAVLLIALREWAAFARLGRLDGIRQAADKALIEKDLSAARAVVSRLQALYAARDELRWGRDRLGERLGDAFDADAALGLAEAELLAPLDAAATREIEAAARQVATVTALVPLAFADVIAALTSNLRMIRRIAEIYGGRGGALGSWRLTRSVLTHLIATGAVAVGDDMIHSLAGGSVLSKLSRRFGEGMVNGALTARVGIAAMEVCRPLAFHGRPRPSVTGTVRRALAGLFGSGKEG